MSNRSTSAVAESRSTPSLRNGPFALAGSEIASSKRFSSTVMVTASPARRRSCGIYPVKGRTPGSKLPAMPVHLTGLNGAKTCQRFCKFRLPVAVPRRRSQKFRRAPP